jgi:hypothetical protein
MFNLFAQNVQNQSQLRTKTAHETVITTRKKSSFRVSDVEFFDSQLNLFYDSEDVVQVRRDLYYRDVYLFVERIKNAVIMFEAKIVRTNLFACLRESAQMWYTEELSDLKKKTLRTLDEETNHWCNALLKKFKKFVVSALNYLITERYTLENVKTNRNIFSFVFQIMRHAKIANIADLHEQFTWAYNAITSELVKNIDSFDENISIMTFLKNLETKKDIWHRIYSRKLTSRIESEFQYQINFSIFFYANYDQSTYSQRQYRQSFENVNDSRNSYRFQSNDNTYLKDKTLSRVQKSFDELNQQSRFSNIILEQNVQLSSFEIQSIRNQAISA